LQNRKKILDRCDKDAEARAYMIRKCELDPKFFINHFGWTYDPRGENEKNLPFILYDFQEDAIDWLEERYKNQETGLIEKSRDMGISWLVISWICHKFIFEDGFSALVGSRKESLVDDRTTSSLFGKIDYFLKRLPEWMIPSTFNWEKNRNHLKLNDQVRSNTIVGESTNQDFGRAGRYSMVLLDEFAFTDNSFSIWRAVTDSSRCKICLSTPNGRGNKFAELRFDQNIPVLTLHWKLHPLKDNQWYIDQCKDRTDVDIAQELDISPTSPILFKLMIFHGITPNTFGLFIHVEFI